MLECSSRRPGYRYGVRIQHEVSGCSYCPVNRRYYISGGHDYDCVYRFKNRIGSNVIDSVYRRSGRNLYFLGDYLCDLSGLVCHPVGLLWADLVSVYSDKRTDLAVLAEVMMASTAIKGFKGMEKLSTFAAIPLLLFIVLALVNCVRLIGVDSLFSYSLREVRLAPWLLA